MKIGVDATCWGNNRGFGRFTRELLGALLEIDKVNEYIFFIDGYTDKDDSIPSQARTVVANTSVSAIEAASANGRRSLINLWAMTHQVLKHKVDVFFFPTVYSYFPILNRTKIVVTIHDVIADHHPKLIFPNTRAKIFWKLKQNVAIWQADLIATVSQYSKQQIREYFGLPDSRLRLITEAAHPIFKVLPSNNGAGNALLRQGLELQTDFLLYVGGISPHKNLSTLIDAFSRIASKPRFGNLKLVLTGDYKNDPFFSAYPELNKQVRIFGLEDRIIFTGFVPDEDLAYLYNQAKLLVFPSFEEGFGLPAIEAMACGTPVAASNCGSLPEVLGNAGCFFDPHNPASMEAVIEEILSDDTRQDEMKVKGLKRSKQFVWKQSAEDALAIFMELRNK